MTSTTRAPSKRRLRDRQARRPGTTEASGSYPIHTRGLTKAYGDLLAVDHLDLDVKAGEIFGLLGQNGAGKTTTILMLLGLTEPTDGTARVVGLDPARNPLEVKRRIGYLPDSVGFYADLTGRQNLRYTARLNRIPSKAAEMTMDAVLDQVGMTARADDRAGTYSRGMLQRLGIADALLKDPDVLVLDEPTTAIDPIGVVEILDLLRHLVTTRGMSILLSSHLLNQVQSVCDRVGIFAAGRLIGVGTVESLAERFGDGLSHVEAGFEFEGDAQRDEVESVIRGIDGVVSVERGARASDPLSVAVRPPGVASRVRQEILATAARDNYHLTSIRSVVPSLEDIYRRAVSRDGAADPGAVQ
jgi:ABC-2 type transport system ATP-binding protein